MKFNARIPVIPLPYKDKNLAVEKELIIEYGHDDVYPNLYIVDEYDRTKLWDITKGIQESLHGSSGDNFTIEIDGLGTIELGEILNLLYTISLTHDEAWSIDTIKQMVPTTIVDNKGIVYAPRTLSTAVYTEAGETIDARLKSISKIGMAVRYTEPVPEDTNTLVVPYPFENYELEGNSFLLYVGTVLVEPDRYFVKDGILEFIDSDDFIKKGRVATFIFIYKLSV